MSAPLTLYLVDSFVPGVNEYGLAATVPWNANVPLPPSVLAFSGTSWTLPVATTRYAEFQFNTNVPGSAFSATVQPSGGPAVSFGFGNAFRSDLPIWGTIASGSWTMPIAVQVTSGAATGTATIRRRVWKSTDPEGSGATELTSATLVSSSINTATTSQQNLTMTWSPGSAFTLNGEYLFFVDAIEKLTGAGTPTIVYVQDPTNSVVVTPALTWAKPQILQVAQQLGVGFPRANVAGNCIVALIGFDWEISGTFTSVTDTAGNSYTIVGKIEVLVEDHVGDAPDKLGYTSLIAVCLNCKAAASGNTIGANGSGYSGGGTQSVICYELGSGYKWALDTSADSASGTNTPGSPSVSLTAAGANELVIAQYFEGSGISAYDHYPAPGFLLEFLFTAAAGSVTLAPSVSSAQDYVMSAVALIPTPLTANVFFGHNT